MKSPLHQYPALYTGTLILLALFTACSNKVEESKSGVITSPLTIGIRNLTVAEIIPNKAPVNIDWKGYGTLSSNALNVGYEMVVASDSVRTFVITDKGTGKNQFSVNGQKYTFNSQNQHLEINFRDGVKITAGSDYQTANHVYDIDFPAPK